MIRTNGIEPRAVVSLDPGDEMPDAAEQVEQHSRGEEYRDDVQFSRRQPPAGVSKAR